MIKQDLFKELVAFVSKNKEAFEVSEFDGDVFWITQMCYAAAARLPGFFHISFYHKPGKFLSVLDQVAQHRIGERIFIRYSGHPEELKDAFYERQKKVLETVKELSSKGSGIKTYKQLVFAVQDFSKIVMNTFEGLELYIQNQLMQKLKGNQAFSVLTTPLYSSYVNQQADDLRKSLATLALEEREMLKKGVGELAGYKKLPLILENHLKEWGWSYLGYASHEIPSTADLLKRIISDYQHIMDSSAILEQRKKQSEKKRLLQAAPPEIKNLITFFDLVVELRDQRKKTWMKLLLPNKNWLKALAGKNGMTYDEISFLTWDEQIALGAKTRKKLLKIAREREKGVAGVFGFHGSDSCILTGKEYDKLLKMVLSRKNDGKIAGVAATKGIVSGKASLIMGEKEFSKFQQGEILVASHTTPDYVRIMKKAKAILTERGGITSHAAIVSRELGIPCIVGIKNLTKLINDGDFIEVDANEGVVRKIR